MGETAIDVTGYAAHIAAQLGATIIKVKLPSMHIEQDAARAVYEKDRIAIATLTDRVKHIMQCAFNGRRIVVFSGGQVESDRFGREEAGVQLLTEIVSNARSLISICF